MNGAPLLEKIAKALSECRLEAVLIGNAAAALHGAPVTTVDVDFMFRKSEANLPKIKKFATLMDAVVRRPYYRVTNQEGRARRPRRAVAGLQIDFMSFVHGVGTFSSLKSRAEPVTFGQAQLLVATLPDIIASKKAADRPHDRAVLALLEKTFNEAKKAKAHKR